MAATPRGQAACVGGGETPGRRAPFVSVAIRVKPCNPDDNVAIWAKQSETGEICRRVCCNRGYLLEEHEFSRVFGPCDANRQLFRDLQGPALTASVFSGISETLFAYGQTGSGKTHTIFGTGKEPGLLQLFVHSVFEQAVVFVGSTVHACCYEVLGDALTDLIDAEPLIERGQIGREDVVYDEMFIKTQKCRYQIVKVSSMASCLELLQEARENRALGVSSCNSVSSRSHAVVHLFVQNPVAVGQAEAAGSGSSSIGALTLVDLAGAEKEQENPSEQGRKSARLLNTSLSSLNRLLRKLQTGTLDESERRQSVLNKCLWDYLKPGCGIALIFCVSPLLRHRATTLSTLAMATDSKLIHSQRKSQFIQMPVASPSHPSTPHQGASPRAAPRQQGYMSTGSLAGASPPRLPGDRTPRQTPRRAHSATGHAARASAEPEQDLAWQARARMADFSEPGLPCGMTPRGGQSTSTPRLSTGSIVPERFTAAAAPQTAQAMLAFDAAELDEIEQLCGFDLRSAAGLRQLALENSKLRRRLSRTRAQSQERCGQLELERKQLHADNAALVRECESLRALFIRQQQQQFAFWTGPFLDVIGSKELASSTSSKVREPGFDKLASPSPARKASADASSEALAASAAARALERTPSALDVEDARALRKERDYWRVLATDLKREMKECAALTRLRGGLQEESDLSTSQSQQEGGGSEPSQGTPWDSGSELSIR